MVFEVRCPGCGRRGSAVCPECWPPVGGQPLAYTGSVRALVLGMKYANARPVAVGLARAVIAQLDDLGAVDIVTWAPTSSARRAERGFDPAELVARAVARQLGRPARPLLRRVAGSGPQTGRSRLERLSGPGFVARPVRSGARVLVVDDVRTTGATLAAAEQALRSAGAAQVWAVAAAATPAGAPR